MAKPKLIEQTLEIGNPIVKSLFLQTGWTEDDQIFRKKDLIAQVVYLSGKNPKYIFSCGTESSNESISMKHNFNELLSCIKKPNFNDYLLLTSFYKDFSLAEDKLKKIITSRSPFAKNELLDGILSISKGYLAYGHQYELLAEAIFGVSYDASRRLRKNHNMKLHGMYDSFQKKDAAAFKKILSERILTNNNLLTKANWVGAKNLLEWSYN